MKRWLNRWQQRPRNERDQILLVLVLLVVGLYAGLLWPRERAALSKVQGDLKELQVRQARQARQAPAASLGTGGKSPFELRREVAELQQRLEREGQRLAQLEPRFVQLEQTNEQQQLKEALSLLAAGSDLNVVTMSHLGVRKEEEGVAPTAERIRQLEANPWGRPLMRFEAKASYRGLMQFLDGLRDLPYVVAPVWVAIEVATEKGKDGKPARQWLEVKMNLAL